MYRDEFFNMTTAECIRLVREGLAGKEGEGAVRAMIELGNRLTSIDPHHAFAVEVVPIIAASTAALKDEALLTRLEAAVNLGLQRTQDRRQVLYAGWAALHTLNSRLKRIAP